MSRMSGEWGAAMSPHLQQQQASSVQGFGPLGIPAQDPQAMQLEAQLAELRHLQLHRHQQGQGGQGSQARTLWEAPGYYGNEVRPQVCACSDSLGVEWRAVSRASTTGRAEQLQRQVEAVHGGPATCCCVCKQAYALVRCTCLPDAALHGDAGLCAPCLQQGMVQHPASAVRTLLPGCRQSHVMAALCMQQGFSFSIPSFLGRVARSLPAPGDAM